MRSSRIEPGSGAFLFGKNWLSFARHLDETSIERAQRDLKSFLNVEHLQGLTFLDAGSGSGLHSLVACRMGAIVTAFDYDPDSVECTRKVIRENAPPDASWTATQGSCLDGGFMAGLGQFDVVYSWGVLHHTGSMWEAITNTATLVKPRGKLFISIYNDLGASSVRWTKIKRFYNELPSPLRLAMALGFYALQVLRMWFYYIRCLLLRAIQFKSLRPCKDCFGDPNTRGMRRWHDCVDWVGGYPYEVAKPEDVFHFLRKQGFLLENMKTCGGGHGCNEYLFTRIKG